MNLESVKEPSTAVSALNLHKEANMDPVVCSSKILPEAHEMGPQASVGTHKGQRDSKWQRPEQWLWGWGKGQTQKGSSECKGPCEWTLNDRESSEGRVAACMPARQGRRR